MIDEPGAIEDIREVWAEAVSVLPGKGILPDHVIPGAVVKGSRPPEVMALLHRDASLGFSPFDAVPWWRVVSRPADSVRRGYGRAGVSVVRCAAPLFALDAATASEPPVPVDEPFGMVRVGPADARVVLAQAVAAYGLALRVAGGGRGSMLGLPTGGAP